MIMQTEKSKAVTTFPILALIVADTQKLFSLSSTFLYTTNNPITIIKDTIVSPLSAMDRLPVVSTSANNATVEQIAAIKLNINIVLLFLILYTSSF